jgi:hypothetical protein
MRPAQGNFKNAKSHCRDAPRDWLVSARRLLKRQLSSKLEVLF